MQHLPQLGEGTSTPHLTWTDALLPDEGLSVLEIAAAVPSMAHRTCSGQTPASTRCSRLLYHAELQ